MNKWLLVRPGETGELIDFDSQDPEQRKAVLNGQHGCDFASLSHQFHYMVYEWSITESWPLNWEFTTRRGRLTPVCGPALIYKCNEHGETIDVTPEDAEALRDWIAACRVGVMIDGMSLDAD